MVGRRMPVENTRTTVNAQRTNEQHDGPYPRWMTVETCARYIDRTPEAIQSLVKRGQIPVIVRAGRRQFDRYVIDEWMKTGNLPE
jgi:hypothetical protein